MMDLHDQHVLEWMHKSVHGGTCTLPTATTALHGTRPASGIHLISAYADASRAASTSRLADTARYYRNIAGKPVQLQQAARDAQRIDCHRPACTCQHRRVVFGVRGHVIGFANGETSDWADNRRHHQVGTHFRTGRKRQGDQHEKRTSTPRWPSVYEHADIYPGVETGNLLREAEHICTGARGQRV